MDIVAEPDAASAAPPPSLAELILSLEQATLLAKQIPNSTDPTHLLQIYSSLHHTHHHLSSFLSTTHHLPPPPATENSLSSATGAADNEPMQVGEDAEEETSMAEIDEVEEKMRDCFIKNKRPKRSLSPASMAVGEERRLNGDGGVGRVEGFDPHGTRLRALDLVYQFHG